MSLYLCKFIFTLAVFILISLSQSLSLNPAPTANNKFGSSSNASCTCGNAGTGGNFSLAIKQNSVKNGKIFHSVATKPHNWPWITAITQGYSATLNSTSNFDYLCAGLLIHPQYVLSAASCFGNFTNNSQIISQVKVLLGTNSISSKVTGKSVSSIRRISIHPKFNKSSHENDIAILQLSATIPLSKTIQPICLNQSGSPFNSSRAIVAGWGATGPGSNNSHITFLREAEMQTMPNRNCKKYWQNISSSMICGSGISPSNNSAPCNSGDKGSPLMLLNPTSKSYSLIGIFSFGATSCGQGVASVFTRISSFMKFISASIKMPCNEY